MQLQGQLPRAILFRPDGVSPHNVSDETRMAWTARGSVLMACGACASGLKNVHSNDPSWTAAQYSPRSLLPTGWRRIGHAACFRRLEAT